MFETTVLTAMLVLPLMFAVLYLLRSRRKSRPTLNHSLLASGSFRRGEPQWTLRRG
jgi:hypothetical protein